MKRLPQGRYTPEFREEAVKLVIQEGLTSGEASRRLSLPKSTLENWVRMSKAGKLTEIGKGQRPLTEIEVELARVKREGFDFAVCTRYKESQQFLLASIRSEPKGNGIILQNDRHSVVYLAH